jgi:phosphoribosylaminoimidazole-succinocarboxamide synthase
MRTRPSYREAAQMNPQRERAEKQRQVKLEAVAQQVAEGSLTIRQMTPEERKKYPKPDTPRPQRRRRP